MSENTWNRGIIVKKIVVILIIGFIITVFLGNKQMNSEIYTHEEITDINNEMRDYVELRVNTIDSMSIEDDREVMVDDNNLEDNANQ